jgi:hypothetical protein
MSSATATLAETSAPKQAPQEHLSPNQQAWRRFKRNRMAVASSIFVLSLVALVLVFVPTDECSAVLASTWQLVHEPIGEWVSEPWAGERSYRYRVEGAVRTAMTIIRL